MKINIDLKTESHGFQMADAAYAWLQSFYSQYKIDGIDVTV